MIELAPLIRAVLIVEDDPIIRMGTVEAFAGAGFRVVEASHADHALAFLIASAREIHALFTDVQMPRSIHGIHLAHRASRSWPWVRILVASGRRTELHELPPKSRFLSKPYDTDHAIAHIREMIAEA